MVGHGADKEYQPQSWMHGSQVYMSRTKAEVSPEVMASGTNWEFFGGYEEDEADSTGSTSDSGTSTAKWVDNVADAAPIFTWENRTGVVTMTYMPAVKKYIMVVSTCTWANGTKSTVGPFDTYFLVKAKNTASLMVAASDLRIYMPRSANMILKLSMPCGGAGVRFYNRPVQDHLVRRKRHNLLYSSARLLDYSTTLLASIELPLKLLSALQNAYHLEHFCGCCRYLAEFGPESYFVNIPSSMLDEKGGGFLSYSANFA
jgi:hypothetical protein